MSYSRPSLLALAAAGALTLGACGKDTPNNPSPTPTPTPTPTPAPQANRAPTISSMSAAPGFGIAMLTTFAMTASATDADGDTLTFDWDLGDGSRASGPGVSKTYLTGGLATITLTVSDGRGASATDRRTVTVGSMGGTWSGTQRTTGTTASATMQLTQVGGVVTGTMVLAGFNGRTDPAQLGHVDTNGAFEIRWKVDPFLDFTMRGQMDLTGTHISGGTFGSGFNGDAFSYDKR